MAIFARNEERHIRRAIQSVFADVPGGADVRVHVLINGCTDNTEAIVTRCAAEHPGQLSLVRLPVRDKCNAWNAYVHRLADDSPVHFFMDGDVQVHPGSLTRMAAALLAEPDTHAIGGLPFAGRNREWLRRLMLERSWIYGNLYAVRGAFLGRLRDCGVRLPLGLMGNDALITHLLKECPSGERPTRPRAITHDEAAGYTFEPLHPLRPDDIRVFARRSVTNRLRAHQLREIGFPTLDTIPRTMDDINLRIFDRLERERPRHLLDHLVLRRLRRMYGRTDAPCRFYEEQLPLAA